ncbi:Beta-catenin [Trema orientale]|uniref:Beta-catenin n=1 Tax=Trema orientale TaxID=63057 RepID=A0A2P5EEU3_TREOI|nr:Beta-catenin [Trema orientale]
MEGGEPPCPSPSPYKFSSSLFKDISNFKTPKRPSQKPNFQSPCPQFFTASKHTPRTSSSLRHRPSPAPPSTRIKTARKLKALELEQSQSSRKNQIEKERSLKSLAKSLTVWLNFLFENPGSCGCELGAGGGNADQIGVSKKGKRDGFPGIGVRVDAAWRNPKRQRDLTWRAAVGDEDEENAVRFSNCVYSSLQSSLKDVCSFEDLKQRMRVYLSLGCCKEVFDVMTQVAKHIDEGRLKMKAHCPLVSDVGLRDKATRILMCYNPVWLRIGLYIILGGDSLLSDGEVNFDEEMAFLRMIIEKQFFSHAGLAKAYAYNKMVEGLYRPGYYETLGNIVLKRFLLLVLVLDRAKCQSSLSLKYGIDGVDGGSPLLFTLHSSIKSSLQVIHDFLSSDIMLGEGNILAHLMIIGFKVSYQQSPLVEYDFQVRDLFVDLQDGVRLCRATQLLLDEPSILTKLVVPSDTRKKYLANCGVVLQYLRQAGVALYDDDGVTIMGDDVANGDKELTLSLLWNIFVHLQLPLLMKKTMIFEEICKIRGPNMEQLNTYNTTPLEMILSWIQAICQKYDCKIDNFSSLVDGKAIWCLLDYYFRKELSCSCSLKDSCRSSTEESIVLVADYLDAVHNFLLSQKLTALLGNFPEVLQISDILEFNGACNDRSVIILLVFLASQLIVKKNVDQLNFHKLLGCHCQSPGRKYSSIEQCFRSPEAEQTKDNSCGHSAEDAARKFKAIQAWWRDMTERNYPSVAEPTAPILRHFSSDINNTIFQRENAAKVIQSHFRRLIERRKFLKMLNAASLLQTIFRALLIARNKTSCINFTAIQGQESSCERWKQSEHWTRYATFITDRYGFLKLKKSALLIQRVARNWITQRRHNLSDVSAPDPVNASIVIQKYLRGWLARSRYVRKVVQIEIPSPIHLEQGADDFQRDSAVKIQFALKNSICNSLHNQQFAATQIQSHFRGWLLRRRFKNQRQAVLKIQTNVRMSICSKAYQQYRISIKSATIIQSFVRQWICQKEACRRKHFIVTIQRHYRGWLVRRYFLSQREAVIKIQSAIRGMKCWNVFHCQRQAALEIQRFVRGQITRKKLIGASSVSDFLPSGHKLRSSCGYHQSFGLKLVFCSVVKLQRWWRGVLSLKLRTKSALIIQSHVRGWIARRNATRERHCIVVIQSYWKGYLARKESREQLLDLRLRMQRSAANVDDGMRIINRLIAALSELLSKKSISGILHTCATLDMATQYSQKCCEKLVDAGAIDTLLKLIRSVSRSTPDQEVLKHALSTLRNLARYPHLVEVIIDCHGSVETILWEMLRNKEEGYFIASELLRKICSSRKGVEAVRRSPALLKRLHSHVEELTRKAHNEKRNVRGSIAKAHTDRRLKEAVILLKMATG